MLSGNLNIWRLAPNSELVQGCLVEVIEVPLHRLTPFDTSLSSLLFNADNPWYWPVYLEFARHKWYQSFIGISLLDNKF
jgi:hypothetical protein